MMRMRSWSCIGVMVLAGAATPARAQVVALPQLALAPQLKASSSAAPIKPSELNGVVKDELGKPLPGAVVSALGSTSAFAVSNEDGHFTFRNLPPGPYLVRAHLQNYLPSRSRVVQVNADGRTLSTIELTRKPGSSTDPGVIAAGVGMIDQPASAAPAEAEERHEHDSRTALDLQEDPPFGRRIIRERAPDGNPVPDGVDRCPESSPPEFDRAPGWTGPRGYPPRGACCGRTAE